MLLNIKQLLDLDASYSFDITAPELSVPESFTARNSEELYTTALDNLPDVKSANAKVYSAERSLAIAQGGRSPRLSLFGSMGDRLFRCSPKNNWSRLIKFSAYLC